MHRARLERRSNEFLRKLGQLSESGSTAHAARKYGLMSKVRVRDRDLTRVVFAAKNVLESSKDDCGMPRWGSEDRTPEAGRRKRATTDAVKQLQAKYSQIYLDSSGTIW